MQVMRIFVVSVICIVGTTAAIAGPRWKPYCEGYYDTLQQAVNNRRRGMPNYSHSPTLIDDWRADIDFIYSKPPEFDFQDWISRRYGECLENTPHGPGEQSTLVATRNIKMAALAAYAAASNAINAKEKNKSSAVEREKQADEKLYELGDAHVEYAGFLKHAYKQVKANPSGHSVDVKALVQSADEVAKELAEIVAITKERDSEALKMITYYADAAQRNADRVRKLLSSQKPNSAK